MKTWLIALLLLPLTARAQVGTINGYCDVGGTPAKVSGLSSTNYLQGNIPSCTVSVYLTGTQTLAPIYASGSGVGSVSGVTITAVGYYPTCPTVVTFTGGGGSGAAGIPICAGDGAVIGVQMTAGGAGYATAPTVGFSGGSGGGAAGTATLAATLSNPFTANTAGSISPGGFVFWAALNQGYDVIGSGGIPPNAYAQPVVLCTDCFPEGSSSGGGGSGGSSPPEYSIQYASPSGGFGSYAGDVIDPNTGIVTGTGFDVPGSGTGIVNLAGAGSGGIYTLTVDPNTGTWTDTVPTAAPTVNGQCRVGSTTGAESWSSCIQLINPGWYNTLGASQGATDTTATLSGSPAAYAPNGCFYIQTEWECYTGISGNELTGLTRGANNTTPASHSASDTVTSINFFPGSAAVAPQLVFAGSNPTILGLNNATPTSEDASAVLVINSGSDMVYFATDGQMFSDTSAQSQFQGSLLVKGGITLGGNGLTEGSLEVPILNSNYVFQTTAQNTANYAMGFVAGLGGPISTVISGPIAAPTAQVLDLSGSDSRVYECDGLDQDGGVILGTQVTVSNLPASWTSGYVILSCPATAGVKTYVIRRDSGGSTQGVITTVTGSGGLGYDNDQAGDSTSAPSVNTQVIKVCNNNEQYCLSSGTSSTPNFTCSGSTQGWEYQITGATSSPFRKVCNGTSFVTAY